MLGAPEDRVSKRAHAMNLINNERDGLSIKLACEALNASRATFYRKFYSKKNHGLHRKKNNHRRLNETERQDVLNILHEPRFVDKAPAEINAILLDEGRYHCSTRTMYRILHAHQEVRERRNQLKHPKYTAPELLATKPNQLWSWDITKLKGPGKWTYYYLYVILDVYSRYVVGWMIATRESSELAKQLINSTCKKESISKDTLTIHADRGSSMTSKTVGLLLSDLGVKKTHSRPYVSNDNPYSESQFKTMKYRAEFPKRFGSIEDARGFTIRFMKWYNEEHRHEGISMLTPFDVHHGFSEERLSKRNSVLLQAYEKNPERFVFGKPKAKDVPSEVWINKPKTEVEHPHEDESRKEVSAKMPCAVISREIITLSGDPERVSKEVETR